MRFAAKLIEKHETEARVRLTFGANGADDRDGDAPPLPFNVCVDVSTDEAEPRYWRVGEEMLVEIGPDWRMKRVAPTPAREVEPPPAADEVRF